MALPCGAMGLSAVYECGIFLSYSLTILVRLASPKLHTRPKVIDILYPEKNILKVFTLYGHGNHLGQVTINFKSY